MKSLIEAILNKKIQFLDVAPTDLQDLSCASCVVPNTVLTNIILHYQQISELNNISALHNICSGKLSHRECR